MTHVTAMTMVLDDGLRPGWLIKRDQNKIYEQSPDSEIWHYVCTYQEWESGYGIFRDQYYLFKGDY